MLRHLVPNLKSPPPSLNARKNSGILSRIMSHLGRYSWTTTTLLPPWLPPRTRRSSGWWAAWVRHPWTTTNPHPSSFRPQLDYDQQDDGSIEPNISEPRRLFPIHPPEFGRLQQSVSEIQSFFCPGQMKGYLLTRFETWGIRWMARVYERIYYRFNVAASFSPEGCVSETTSPQPRRLFPIISTQRHLTPNRLRFRKRKYNRWYSAPNQSSNIQRISHSATGVIRRLVYGYERTCFDR